MLYLQTAYHSKERQVLLFTCRPRKYISYFPNWASKRCQGVEPSTAWTMKKTWWAMWEFTLLAESILFSVDRALWRITWRSKTNFFLRFRRLPSDNEHCLGTVSPAGSRGTSGGFCEEIGWLLLAFVRIPVNCWATAVSQRWLIRSLSSQPVS